MLINFFKKSFFRKVAHVQDYYKHDHVMPDPIPILGGDVLARYIYIMLVFVLRT